MGINKALLQSFLAEFLISFLFGYAVYGSVMSTKNPDYPVSGLAVPLAVAFSGIALIYTFIDHTVCHFNPAITLSAILTLKIPFFIGIGYIIAQGVGFIAAVGMVMANFSLGYHGTINLIVPGPVDPGTTSTALFFTEFILTAILVFVAFEVGINSRRNPDFSFYGDEKQIDRSIVVPVTIGLTLGLLAILGSTTSGGAFNPGIVFAPQVLGGSWGFAWEYYASQFAGGLLGALIQVWLLFK